MSPDSHDEVRAAAALLAFAASGRRGWRAGQAFVLGDDDPARCAAVAAILAAWLARVLRDGGTDPLWFAKQAIAESIAEEATEDAEGPP